MQIKSTVINPLSNRLRTSLAHAELQKSGSVDLEIDPDSETTNAANSIEEMDEAEQTQVFQAASEIVERLDENSKSQFFGALSRTDQFAVGGGLAGLGASQFIPFVRNSNNPIVSAVAVVAIGVAGGLLLANSDWKIDVANVSNPLGTTKLTITSKKS